MRFLHTADWHVGKRIVGRDRQPELEDCFDEIARMARDQKVDAVLISGDLFESEAPAARDMFLVADAILKLADAGGQVVAIAGNHDSPEWLRFLSTALRGRSVIIASSIARPQEGGVVRLKSKDGSETASIALMPFLKEALVVDFMEERKEWVKAYADRIRLLAAALVEGFSSSDVGIMMGHFFVSESEVGGGERPLSIGDTYAATSHAIPPSVHYAALGHVHKPQAIKGSAVAARYSGSLLQLDFSEVTHKKEVVIIDATAVAPAKVKSLQLASGRRVLRVRDSIESLQKRAEAGEFAGGYCEVRVLTAGPELGLADRVRRFMPEALKVSAEYPRLDPDTSPVIQGGVDLIDAYSDYYRRNYASPAPAKLLKAFEDIERETADASS